MKTRVSGRGQTKLSWQTKVALASVLIGTSFAWQGQTVKAETTDSAVVAVSQTEPKTEAALTSTAEQEKDSAQEATTEENTSDEKSSETETTPETDSSKETDTPNKSDDKKEEQDSSAEKAVKNTDYSIVYGDKDKIPSDDLHTRVLEIRDKDTGEVLAKHTIHYSSETFSDNVVRNIVNWYDLNFIASYGLDYNDYKQYYDLDSDEKNKTVTIEVSQKYWQPELKDPLSYDYLDRCHLHTASEENNVDPALFLQKSGLMPKDTEVTWTVAPKWGISDPEYPRLQVTNPDEVALQVKVPGQEAVVIKGTDQEGWLLDMLNNLTFGDPQAELKNVINTPLGELPNPDDLILKPGDYEEDPVWGINPNIGRAGFSYGWLALNGDKNNNYIGSGRTMVIVRTDPLAVKQQINYVDEDGNQLASTGADGKIYSLYTVPDSFKASDLAALIDGHIPAGYEIADGFSYPGDIVYSKDLKPIVVKLVKKQTNPTDPKKDPEEQPTTPEEKPTTPEDKPTIPEQPVVPVVPEVPTEPDQPADPETPDVPEDPEKPVEPGMPVSPLAPAENAHSAEPVKAAKKTQVAPQAAKLPQTGDQESRLAQVLGLVSLAAAGLLGLFLTKKRNKQ